MNEIFNVNDVEKTFQLTNYDEIEIRVIEPKKGSKNIKTFHTHNKQDFINKAKEFSGQSINQIYHSVFFGVNERKKGCSKEKDIFKVNILPIDLDYKRESYTSTTDEQVKYTIEIGHKLRQWFIDNNFEAPSMSMSGNGVGLYLKVPAIPFKNNEAMLDFKAKWTLFTKKIRKIITNMTDKVEVDYIQDLSRIFKIVGTMSVKGNKHRLTKWIEYNNKEDENLKEYIMQMDAEEEKTKPIEVKPLSKDMLKKIIEDANIQELLNMKGEQGKRSELEQKLFNKLVLKGITDFKQLDAIMSTCKIGKWQEGTKSYKEHTYKNSLAFVAKLKKNKPKQTGSYISVELSDNRYLINNKSGIFIQKEQYDKNKKEPFYTKERTIHTWHIEKVIVELSAYMDDFYFKIFVTDNKHKRELKGTIDEVAELFKKIPGCCESRSVKDCMSHLVSFLQTEERVEIEKNPLTTAFGFAYDKENKKIIIKDVLQNTKMVEEVTKEQLKKGLDALFTIIDSYNKSESHRNELIRIMATGLIYPFGYIRKQMLQLAPFVIVNGPSGTGKTLSGDVILCMWGCWGKRGFEHSGSTVNGAYQLAKKCSENTMFLLINEAGQFLAKFSENNEITELLKNMVESPFPIRDKKSGMFISFRTPFLTANYPFKFSTDALRLKTLVFSFENDFTHSGDERAEVMQLLSSSERDLSYIGSWLTNKVSQHDKKYFDIITQKDYAKASMDLLKELLADSGMNHDLPTPPVVGSYINNETTSFWENMIDYMRIEIIKRAKQVASIDESKEGLNVRQCIDIIIDKNNLPTWLITIHKDVELKVLVPAEIQQYVQTFSKETFEMGVYEKEVKNRDGYDYVKSKNVRVHGKSTKKSGMYVLKSKFVELFEERAHLEKQKTLSNSAP